MRTINLSVRCSHTKNVVRDVIFSFLDILIPEGFMICKTSHVGTW